VTLTLLNDSGRHAAEDDRLTTERAQQLDGALRFDGDLALALGGRALQVATNCRPRLVHRTREAARRHIHDERCAVALQQAHVATVAHEYRQIIDALGKPRVVEAVDAYVGFEGRETARAACNALFLTAAG
jgi:hypothetical protein